jgi:hypothetical protein
MATDAFKASGSSLCLTANGTVVGMPKRCGSRFELRDPERWSEPPPAGVEPIIPCVEPEDKEGAELEDYWRGLRAPVAAPLEPTPLPKLPIRRGIPSEERRLLAWMAIVAALVVCITVALVARYA